VIAGHPRGGLEAFEIAGGERRWHRNADQSPFTNSNGDVWPNYFTPVAAGDRMILGHGRALTCLDTRTGNVLWEHATPYPYYLPGALVSSGSVWVPNAQPNDRLVRLRLADGQVMRRASAAGIPVSWTAVDDRLFIVVLDKWIGGQGHLQCRSAATGRMIWHRPLGGDPAHAYQYYASDGPPCQAPPRLVGDRLYLACTDGSIRTFNPSTGANAGAVCLESPLFSAPLIDGDRLWSALWSGRVACMRV
jgi:outer membrane protein assembly factor BamB